MADRIWLNMEDLDVVNNGLKAAITEFKEVSDKNDAIEDAIGRPAFDGKLRDKVSDFESDWNDNREQLNEKLTKVQEHLQGILDGFRELDTELATSMSDAERDQLRNPGRDNQPV